jgi:hypothetical protein
MRPISTGDLCSAIWQMYGMGVKQYPVSHFANSFAAGNEKTIKYELLV